MEYRKYLGTVALGFSAASFAGLLGLLQVSKLDLPLNIALYCYAFSLPINAFLGVTLSYQPDWLKKLENPPKIFTTALSFSFTGASAGVFATFMHFNSYASAVFGISCVIASLIFRAYASKFKQ